MSQFEFIIQNRKDNNIYEISQLISYIKYTDSLNNGCSKLDFNYVDDGSIDIPNGSVIRFTYNKVGIFYGYVFKNERGKGREVSVIAYDQLRYLKAKDIVVVQGGDLSDLVTKACNYFKLRKGMVTSTQYTLPVSVHDNKTWLDIIYECIDNILIKTSRKYCLRDEFGLLSLRNLEDLQLDLILGDGSLCYDFKYSKSIDEDTYNLIKLVKKNEQTGKVDLYIAQDSSSFGKWGLLQFYSEGDKDSTDQSLKDKADSLLKLLNREVESLKVSCLGDTSVRAGNSIIVNVGDLGLHKRLIVNSVSHSFVPLHTMEVELCI